MDFAGNLPLFPAVKTSENQLRIDKVIATSLMYYFFGTQCILNKIYSVSEKTGPLRYHITSPVHNFH